jgi:hypothetical protein
MENFIGKDGFYWWLGVVEDTNDPIKLGRCRVRIFGWHTDNLEELPTNQLPWASPCISPNNANTSSVPLVGDYVFGFFTDSESAQAPVLLGVLPGIPSVAANSNRGFSSGSHYPLNEPTTSRLYRNEKISQTVIGQHDDSLDLNVPTAVGSTWNEPKSAYATVPPNNNVIETPGGHVFEMDDTPGAKRIQLAHEVGSFFEIAPDGSKVTKVVGKNYEVYLSDNNIHVKGTCNITVDGNTNIYAKQDANIKVDGNSNWTVGGDMNMQIAGKFIASATEFNLTGPIEHTGNHHTTGNMIIDGFERVGLGITTGIKGIGNITAVGNIDLEGSINATGDVVGSGISLRTHTHSGVQPGGGNTGQPNS